MNVASGVSYWDAIVPGLLMGLIAVGVLPWLDRNNTLARTVGIGVCLFLGWRYMLWRFTETLPPLSEPLDFSIGLVFTLVEMLSMLGTTLALFFLTRTKDRTPEANANVQWLKSLPEQPLVDVLICTYNEEEAILERTIIGALGIDYPRYRCGCCDDGRRAWLKDAVRTAQLRLHHPARQSRTPRPATSTTRLKRLATLRRAAGVHFRPRCRLRAKSQFLTRAVSLMREPDVGVVQTPQHFFNPDPIQTNSSRARLA